MAYRDDLDAALARVAALERALSDEKADREELQAQLARARAELARVREAGATPPSDRAHPSEVEPPSKVGRATWWIVGPCVGLLVAFALFAWWPRRPPPSCTVESDPPGAILSDGDTKSSLGATPFTRTIEEWGVVTFHHKRLVLRKQGFRDVEVTPPATTGDKECRHPVVKLTLVPE